jgi:acetoin utilization protein AcuB
LAVPDHKDKIAMVASDLISEDIPPLRTSDTGTRALQWMEEFRVSHLPIVNHQDFLGLVCESDILDMNSPEEPIGAHVLSLAKPFVYSYQHVYDVLKVLSMNKLTLIPVLNEKDQYLGIIQLSDLLEHFAEMASMKDPGGLLVLELNVNDYSLSEIARIVESNDAKILSLYISSHSDSTRLELTLKINRTDLSAVLQTFSRFNYQVKASFHQSNFQDDLVERLDSLMKFFDL